MIGASRAASTRAYQVLSTTTITSTGVQEATIPAGTVYVEIEMYGAGGGSGKGTFSAGGGKGGGSAQNNAGGAGGGGAYVKHRLRLTDLRAGDELAFVVGEGGAATAHPARKAGDGGLTKLMRHERGGATIVDFQTDDILANGGKGGRSGNGLAQSSDGDGGVAQNGNITNTNGSDGAAQQAGGASAVNGGAGGAAGGPDGGAGGAGGTTTSPGTIAADGTAPGGGAGSGASITNTAGADGADGRVIVKAFG